MTHFADSFALWLGDFYLLSAVLLALALLGITALRQPAQRMAITKSTLVALALLAVLCALPRWSLIHLLTATPQPQAIEPQPLSPIINHPAHRDDRTTRTRHRYRDHFHTTCKRRTTNAQLAKNHLADHAHNHRPGRRWHSRNMVNPRLTRRTPLAA